MAEIQKYQLKMRSLRENAKMTQSEVAQKLGIEQTVYSRYETGRSDIKPFHLVNLCNIYRVSADYILDLPAGRPYGNNNLRLKNAPMSKFDKLADEFKELIMWAHEQEHITNEAEQILLENLGNIIDDLQGREVLK